MKDNVPGGVKPLSIQSHNPVSLLTIGITKKHTRYSSGLEFIPALFASGHVTETTKGSQMVIGWLVSVQHLKRCLIVKYRTRQFVDEVCGSQHTFTPELV